MARDEEQNRHATVVEPIQPNSFPIISRVEPNPLNIAGNSGSATPVPSAVWRFNNAKDNEALLSFEYLATYTPIAPASLPALGPIAGTFLQAYAMPTAVPQGGPATLSQQEQGAIKQISISTTQGGLLPAIYYGGFPYKFVRNLYLRPGTGIVIVLYTTTAAPAGFQFVGQIRGYTWLNGTNRKAEDIARIMLAAGGGD